MDCALSASLSIAGNTTLSTFWRVIVLVNRLDHPVSVLELVKSFIPIKPSLIDGLAQDRDRLLGFSPLALVDTVAEHSLSFRVFHQDASVVATLSVSGPSSRMWLNYMYAVIGLFH